MKLYSINTGYFKLDGGAMFGVVPKVIWQKTNPADENNLCSWAMRSLLIVDGDRRILIDNGIGDKQDNKFFSHLYLHGDDTLVKSLKKYGFTPEDITDNIITHLHFDHCGGGIRFDADAGAYKTVFPNATYWVSEEQWELAGNPNKREASSFLKENIIPMEESGQLQFVYKNKQLMPNVYVKMFYGHTEGQMIPFILYEEKTIVYAADLIPSTGHIPLPYMMSYDTRPLVNLKEKAEFLTKVADENHILFFEHDYYTECCTLQHTEKGVRVDKVFSLSEICPLPRM